MFLTGIIGGMATRLYSSPRTSDYDQDEQMLDAVDRWLTSHVKPVAKDCDRADRYPVEIVEQMKGLGPFGATISEEYGGLGLSATACAKIVMRISSVWMAITGIFDSCLMPQL